jgi:hypothetical protein
MNNSVKTVKWAMRTIIIILFLFNVVTVNAEMVMWVDEDGVKNFSNSGAPRNQSIEIKTEREQKTYDNQKAQQHEKLKRQTSAVLKGDHGDKDKTLKGQGFMEPTLSTICPDGSYVSGDTCTKCIDGSYVSGTRCTMCIDGSYVSGTRCTMCIDGSYVCGDTCTMCPDGSYVSGDTCAMCSDGSYVSGTLCISHPDGTYTGNYKCP